ncbi:hypothetical protein GGQ73_001321 [Rhizobium skierniewicense]|uniref:DUF4424 domain-containing protein n=1 Tax=Rhizobium skierniewicense TaxID=984260 RepID=A0A7W6C7G8_9HYPH|nr:hypothetical protein [Rhizobium skierniewicense]MBB3945388.1 hypothetical protein [Rhizobium skierniewicense]
MSRLCIAALSAVMAMSAPATGMSQDAVAPIETPSPATPPKIATMREGFDLKMLEPVNGIDFRKYGHITYAIFLDPNGNHEAIYQKFGTDKANFDAASAAFGQRMKVDPTFAMVEIFGAYFAENAQGTYAAFGQDVAQSVLNQAPLTQSEPMPEEAFREIQVYYSRKASVAGTSLGEQDEVLKPYHITFNDFNILGAWFSRRLALQTMDLSSPQARSDGAAVEAPTERPEWGGLWRFTWKTLQRTETEMKVVETSRDICVKDDMTADTLPLMPKPEGVKCVLIDKVHFYDSGVQMRAECDLGGIGASWGMYLQPEKDGESFTGQISYNETYEGDMDMPQPTTDVVVKRMGECK